MRQTNMWNKFICNLFASIITFNQVRNRLTFLINIQLCINNNADEVHPDSRAIEISTIAMGY